MALFQIYQIIFLACVRFAGSVLPLFDGVGVTTSDWHYHNDYVGACVPAMLFSVNRLTFSEAALRDQ